MSDKHTPEMYKNHRQRLRRRLTERGGAAIENYSLIELYLFDCLPRVDTYPAAHRLLDRFGTIDGIFSAKREELLEVYGIGPKTADRIVATGKIIDGTVLEFMCRAPLDSELRLFPVMNWLMRNAGTDNSLMIVLDKDFGYIAHNLFSPEDGLKAYSGYIRKTEKLGAAKAVLAHRHPDGAVKPTPDDIALTSRLSATCDKCGVELVEHYVMCGNDFYGIVSET